MNRMASPRPKRIFAYGPQCARFGTPLRTQRDNSCGLSDGMLQAVLSVVNTYVDAVRNQG